MSLYECSVMKEISKTQEAIKSSYERLQALENKIQSDDIAQEKKDAMRRELAEVRKLLHTNETQLSQLHKHNRKTFALVGIFVFLFFTVYSVYILVIGLD